MEIGEYGSLQVADGGKGAGTRFLTLTFLYGTMAELETQMSGAQKWQGGVLEKLITRSGGPLGDGGGAPAPG